MALYWKREERAITASEEKYGPVCRSVSYNILQSRPDAEECVNDTWHRAWNTMPPQRPNSLRAYLCRIVRNLSIDRWRQRYSAKRGGGMEALVLELEECVPAVPSGRPRRWPGRWSGGFRLWMRRSGICFSAGTGAERQSKNWRPD